MTRISAERGPARPEKQANATAMEREHLKAPVAVLSKVSLFFPF